MHSTCLVFLLLFSTLSAAFNGVRRSEENGPCTGKGGAPGVCVSTGACTKAGGDFINDAVCYYLFVHSSASVLFPL